MYGWFGLMRLLSEDVVYRLFLRPTMTSGDLEFHSTETERFFFMGFLEISLGEILHWKALFYSYWKGDLFQLNH